MVKAGIDLGGTYIKAGLFGETGSLLARNVTPTGGRENPDEVAGRILEAVDGLLSGAGLSRGELAGIGLASPGLIDAETGTVLYSNNFNWLDVPFAALLSEKAGLPVRIANDAQCAVLGEAAAGNAAGCRDVVMLTLGTGVGSGIISGGRLLTRAGAGVAGHMTVVRGGRPCTCGKRGCLEAYASASALAESGKQLLAEGKAGKLRGLCGGDPEKVSGALMFSALAAGDPDVEQAVDEYTDYLAAGVCTLVEIFRPEKFLIGGGLSNAGEALLAPVRRKAAAALYGGEYLKMPPLEAALLKNEAGMIGASELLKDEIYAG